MLKKFNIVRDYLTLYFKSLKIIFKASKLRSLLMLITVPLQALIPALSIFIANKLINGLSLMDFYEVKVLSVFWSLLFFLSLLLKPILTMTQGMLTDKLTFYLNLSLLDKASRLKTIDFYEDSKFYDDINIISKEAIWRPVNLLVFGTSIISNLISLISMLILLSSFHFLITSLILISLISQAIIFHKIQKDAFEILVSNSEGSRKLEYYSSAVLSHENIKEVRLFNLYGFFKDKYIKVFTKMIEKVKKNRYKEFFTSLVFLLISTIITVYSFIYIVKGIRFGLFEIGAILVFTSSISYAYQNSYALVEESSLLYDTLLYMDKYFSFMNIENSIHLENGAVYPRDFKEIRFSNLSFSYKKGEKEALKDISFSIKRNEKIAIVGENGSGKSTLVKLLLRFYDVERGAIYMDDTNIDKFDIDEYREHFSTVFQDFAKFEMTIKENIILANLNKDDNEDIKRAMQKSGLSEYEDLKNLDTMLGKKFDGKDLSGGQWQKLSIARSFYADKDILILDEMTSSIDAKTEYNIYRNFRELTEGKTVIFITHRLGACKQADKILLLDNGKVLDFDTHDNLIKDKNGLYYKLYSKQKDLYK